MLETAQREQARQYIEAGADIVVGAHPHCLQGFAFEHGKHVAYSLGNFWFNMDTVETGFLSVRIAAPGEYSVQFEPCIQHGGRTALMEDAEGAALLQYLRALCPECAIYAVRNTRSWSSRSCKEDCQTKAPADDVSAGAFLPDDGMPFKAAGQVLR